MAACSAPPGVDDPGDSLGDEIIFDDEQPSDGDEVEGDDEDEMVFEEEDVSDDPAAAEDLEFTDEEGTQIYLDSIPPTGQWSLTHLQGEMICTDGIDLQVPAEPPVVGTIVMSDDGKTMSFPSEEGTVMLTQILWIADDATRTSFYEGSLIAGGQELTYYVDYKIVGKGKIRGSIEFTFEACRAVRLIDAEYIGP